MNFIKDEESKQLYRKYLSMADNIYYGQVVKTRFLNPYEKSLVVSILNSHKLNFHEYKSHKNAERTILFFSQDDFDPEIHYQENLSVIVLNKRDHDLNHRDVLGSLMSLGIEREMIGDILVDKDLVEINVLKEVADYIRFNLKSIKKLNIELEEKKSIYLSDDIVKFEDKVASISSLRLDSFIAAAVNLSRNDAQKLLSRGFIKLNYVVEDNPSSEISIGDCISIRGYGRYYLQELLGKTRKEKERISIRKII